MAETWRFRYRIIGGVDSECVGFSIFALEEFDCKEIDNFSTEQSYLVKNLS